MVDLGGLRKQSGEISDWMNSKTERHILHLHWWYRIVNIYGTEMVFRERDNEGFCGLVLWCSGCALRGPEKEITLAFQGYVILDAKRQ